MFGGSFILCSKVQFSTGIAKNLIKDNKLIDYTHSIITNIAPKVLEANPILMFEQRNISNEGFLYPILNNDKKQVKDKGGKLLYKTPFKNAFYNGLEFRIYENGLITLSGSLHKYWNGGTHNYNDFGIEEVLFVLKDIQTKFGIEPQQFKLKCFEIGINITPPVTTNAIIDNCFLHKRHSFEHKYNSYEGNYKQWKHSQYIVKLYNKALHYIQQGFRIEEDIMRFEIKYSKMEKINKRGIYTLQDLINYGLQNFKKDLLNEWQNILFFDNTIQIDPLSKKLKYAVLNYSNNNYWTGLIANKQMKNYTYHNNQLKKIINHNSKNVKRLIYDIMSKKIDLLNTKTIQNDSIV